MEQEKLIQYITGNLDETAASSVRQWIYQSDENRSEFYRLKNIYALSRTDNEITELSKDYETFAKKLGPGRKENIYNLLASSLKYAAVIAITIFAVYFLDNRKTKETPKETLAHYHEITAPLGQISEFTFADGSRIWLNSGTSLRFSETPGVNSRKIYLEGEAYFEVTKNENKPFIVYSGLQEATVFGTSFNIRAYSDLNYIETTLIDGSLGIQSKDYDGMVMLNPGEQLKLSLTGDKNILQKVDTNPYEAWKNGKLIFRNKPLGEIATDLERWYNVKISFNDSKIKDFRFSGTILKYKPIDQILEAIKLTSPIRFTIQVHSERSSEIVLYAS
jgi:transmembrane sensor